MLLEKTQSIPVEHPCFITKHMKWNSMARAGMRTYLSHRFQQI